MTEYAVRYGITDIKGIGNAAYEAILSGRPYTSFEDFVERRGTKCNSADIDKLVRIGAFDSLHPNRAELIQRWEWAKRKVSDNLCVWRDEQRLGPNGLPCTRDWSDVPVELKRDGTPKKSQKGPPKACTRACWKYEPHPDPDFEVRPFTAEEIRKIESEMLGVYLSSTPFDDLPPRLLKDCSTAVDLEMAADRDQALVCVQLVSHSTKSDRNGNAMGFFNFLSHDGYKVRAVAFHKTWAKIRHDVYDGRLFFAVLYKSDRGWSVDGLMPA